MIRNNFENLLNENEKIIKFSILLILLFPLTLLIGSLINNIFLVLLSILYLLEIFHKKELKHIKNFSFFLIFIFYLSLLINIFFNTGENFSFERQLGFVRFLFFVLALNYFIQYKNKKYFNLIIQVWVIIFLIVSLDIIFEFIFGFNSLGFKSDMPGRIASFLNKELKIGNFFHGFCFLFLAYTSLHKKRIFIISLFFILIVSFIIGERSNFLKVFIACFIFLIFYKEISKKIKIFTILASILLITFIGINNKNINNRLNQIFEPIKENGVLGYIYTSHYGAHYYAAYKIFLKNKNFGIGLKEFRNESSKKIYSDNPYNIYDRGQWATHPHQIHFEILSETGLFGYFFSFWYFQSY